MCRNAIYLSLARLLIVPVFVLASSLATGQNVTIKGNTNMIENRTCDYKKRSIFYKLLLSKQPQKAFIFAERQGVTKKPNILRRIINKLKTYSKSYLDNEHKEMA